MGRMRDMVLRRVGVDGRGGGGLAMLGGLECW